MADCSKCIHIDVCGKLIFFGRNCNKECLHYKDGSDLVEVVRCENCKFSVDEDGEGWLWCNSWANGTPRDGYCFEGERKENGYND